MLMDDQHTDRRRDVRLLYDVFSQCSCENPGEVKRAITIAHPLATCNAAIAQSGRHGHSSRQIAEQVKLSRRHVFCACVSTPARPHAPQPEGFLKTCSGGPDL
jgi:hypothetical protein